MAAVCYGTNPLGALPLYEEGVNTASVLFYRFSLAVVMLGLTLLIGRQTFVARHHKGSVLSVFSLNLHELKVLILLGLLFAVSSISYYQSFHFMDAGIASTVLFVYPVMVAIIMATCFHERIGRSTVLGIFFSLVGVGLLYHGGSGTSFSFIGFLLVILSALSYAIYIVVINQSHLKMSSLKLTFFVLLFCMTALLFYSFTSPELSLQMPPSPRAWMYACWLGMVPTVLSLVLMTVAVHEVGATPTAIMGALEPMTAVAIGILVFSESLTIRLALGIVLIIGAVILCIIAKRKTSVL